MTEEEFYENYKKRNNRTYLDKGELFKIMKAYSDAQNTILRYEQKILVEQPNSNEAKKLRQIIRSRIALDKEIN